MLSATISGPRRASLIELPRPTSSPGWSVVDVRIAPLCTEFAAFVSGNVSDHLGHEAVGVVSEVSSGSHLAVGQRVVAMPLLGCGSCGLCVAGDYIYCTRGIDEEEPLGTLRETIRKPDRLLMPIPEEVTDDDAALACCALGASFGALERARVSAPDTVLVTGLGPVGLGATVHAVTRGCRVIAIDSNPYRMAMARELGADLVLAPSDDQLEQLDEATRGVGVDVAIECSGVLSAQRLALRSVRRRGQVAFVGNSYGETPIRVSPELIFTGITVFGSWHYNLGLAPRLFAMISRNRSLVRRLVTHRFQLSDIEAAWELQASGECGKVIIEVGST